jgi:glycerate-2-kinase
MSGAGKFLMPLTSDALTIWKSGVEAVRAERLIAEQVEITLDRLRVAGATFSLREVGRICVVGAGKAAGYLAAAWEQQCGDEVARRFGLHGWVNVPADTLVATRWVHLHAARPTGTNEPTPAGVEGSQNILRLVSDLQANDLCILLLTGGGSALLPLPSSTVTLADKLQVTRHLSAAGASIEELNAVRRQLSQIKGGGLARACRAERLISLIISDVIGDPLDVIASGPACCSGQDSPAQALAILDRYDPDHTLIPAAVYQRLRSAGCSTAASAAAPKQTSCRVEHFVLANNQTAVAAAVRTAQALGYTVETQPPESSHTTAEEVGEKLVELMSGGEVDSQAPRNSAGVCWLWGGEPVVRLVAPADRGRGGRNQQVVLAAIAAWQKRVVHGTWEWAILSGGTDGEDGPTDAAGAFADDAVLASASQLGLDPSRFLRANNAYEFFTAAGGLLKTGPTHTNVCDLRVGLVRPA